MSPCRGGTGAGVLVVLGALVACGGGQDPQRSEPLPRATWPEVTDRPRETIARLQQPDGGWCSPGGRHDPATTGLAILAFLKAGYTHRGDLPFHSVVRRGLLWLKGHQRADGRFAREADDRSLFDHALATLAMTEAFGMTDSVLWKDSAQRALDFAGGARRVGGVWHDPDRPPDEDEAGTTVWTFLPFASARSLARAEARSGKPASLRVDESIGADLRRWIESRTDSGTGRVPAVGRTDGPGGLSADALTAACAFLRFHLGEVAQESEVLRKELALLADSPPAPDALLGGSDVFRAYFGALATARAPGMPRDRWREALFAAVEAAASANSSTPTGPGLDVCGPAALAALRCLCEPPLCPTYGYGDAYPSR